MKLPGAYTKVMQQLKNCVYLGLLKQQRADLSKKVQSKSIYGVINAKPRAEAFQRTQLRNFYSFTKPKIMKPTRIITLFLGDPPADPGDDQDPSLPGLPFPIPTIPTGLPEFSSHA